MIAAKQLPLATTTAGGAIVRIATAADVVSRTAGPVVDAALLATAQVNAGTDNNAATNGVFGIGAGVVANVDLGLMSDPITQVSDLGLMSSPVTTTIDLGLFSA